MQREREIQMQEERIESAIEIEGEGVGGWQRMWCEN